MSFFDIFYLSIISQMLPKKNQLGRTSTLIYKKEQKPQPNKIVDFSIPFLFPYVVGSDDKSQAKTFYNNSSSTLTTQTNQSVFPAQKRHTYSQNKIIESKKKIRKSTHKQIRRSEEIQLSKNETVHKQTISDLQEIQQQAKSINSSRSKPKILKSRMQKQIIQAQNINFALNQTTFQRFKRRAAKPINSIQPKSSSGIFDISNGIIQDQDKKQQNQHTFAAPNLKHKLHRRNTSNDNIFIKQINQSPNQQINKTQFNPKKVRNSIFVKPNSRNSDSKLLLFPMSKKFAYTEPSQQSISNDTIDNSTSQLGFSKKLSRFSKRNNTSINKLGSMFRSSVLKSNPIRNISGRINSTTSNLSSHLNLIHQQNFGTLTVIKQDSNKDINNQSNNRNSRISGNRASILKQKNRVTISNQIQGPRASKLSRSSKIKQNKTILKKNSDLRFIDLNGLKQNQEDSSQIISTKNIMITQRRNNLNKSRKSIKSSKSIKSIKSSKSLNRLVSQQSKITSEDSLLPDIPNLFKPCESNAVYRYLNHLISKNNLNYQQSSFSSEQSLPSLANIDVSRKRHQLKAKLNEDLKMVRTLQQLNRHGANPNVNNKYQMIFQVLEHNQNSDQLIIERNHEFGLETKVLRVLKGVETQANKLTQIISTN